MRDMNVTLTDLKFGSPRSGHASLWSVPGWLLSVSSHRLSFLKAFVCLRFYYFRFLYLCVGACMGAQMSGEAGRDCQLSLGLQAIVGHLAWILGTLLKSSARALFALNQLSHLSRPCLSFFIVSVLIISIAFVPSRVSSAFSKDFLKRPVSIPDPLRIRALSTHFGETRD